MAIVETVSVFGALCSIYQTVIFIKKRVEESEKKSTIKKAISSINIFKETHNYAQSLREFCRGYSEEPLDPKNVTKAQFDRKLRRLEGKCEPFTHLIKKFQTDDFKSEQLEVDPKYPYKNELQYIKQSIINILIYADDIDPKASEVVAWNRKWNKGQYKADSDLTKFKSYLFKFEEPARQIMLAADSAILRSLTIINGTAEKIL